MTARHQRAAVFAALALSGAVALAGCNSGGSSAKSAKPATTGEARQVSRLTVTSSAFGEGQPVPAEFTCSGSNVSPPLSWTDPPSGTTSFAIVVDDPDAPSGTFLHWLITGIGPERRSIAPGERPAGVVEGSNGAGRPGYTGPCPPAGPAHHYRFSVYALPAPPAGLDPAAVRAAALAEGTLTGTFAR